MSFLKSTFIACWVFSLSSGALAQNQTTTRKDQIELYANQFGSFDRNEIRTSEDFTIKAISLDQRDVFTFHINCAKGSLAFVHEDQAGKEVESGKFNQTSKGWLDLNSQKVLDGSQASGAPLLDRQWATLCPKL